MPLGLPPIMLHVSPTSFCQKLRQSAIRLILLSIAMLVCVTSVPAQLKGTLAPKPMGVGYMRDLNEVTIMQYAMKLSQRIEIGKSLLEQIETPEDFTKIIPDVKQPLQGAAYYMVQGFVPSFETIYFKQVKDAADAKRVLAARAKLMGDNSKLEPQTGDNYKMVNSNSWTVPTPEGMSPEDHAKQINEQQVVNGGNYVMSAKVVQEDGKDVVKQSFSTTEYYRIHQNLMFSSGFEELFTMDLPTPDSITSGVNESDDMGIELFFNRIPDGIKQIGWGMLNGGAGAQMQQRDNEEAVIADVRKRSIQFGLDLVKSLMFDTDEANGWLRFATEEEQSIRGELNFEARRNSSLSKRLEETSSGVSRFASVLRDDAVATTHLCLRIFEPQDSMLDALGRWLVHEVGSNGDEEITQAATEVARTLNGIGEHRTLEALVKVGWSEETDGVIYGGLQVDNNIALLRSLHTLYLKLRPSGEHTVHLEEKDGKEVIHLQFPEPLMKGLKDNSSLTLSHAWIVHHNSCLWFAVGNENAYKILKSSMDRGGETGLASGAPLLTANIDTDRWMELPEDDPVGVGNLLRWMDANQPAFPPNPMTIAMGGFGVEIQKPKPLLKPVFDLGGERNARCTIIADRGGLRLSLNIGEAIGNYYLARIIDMQDGFSSSINSVDESDEAVEEPQAVPE